MNQPKNRVRLVDNLLAGKAQKLTIYGTSLSYHLAPVLRMTFHARFGELISVINSGMSGCASRTGLQSLEDKVLRHKPDTLLMEWAINDAHDYHHVPGAIDQGISQEESRENLSALIERIESSSPNTEILLWTTNPTFDVGAQVGRSARPELEGYYRGVREVASARGLRVIDAENFWNLMREHAEDMFRALIPDGVHPTPTALRAHLVPFLLEEMGVPTQTS